MFNRAVILCACILLITTSAARAQGRLLYLEAQGIAGYSSAEKRMIFYSMRQEDAMQKPGLGFDYLERFAGETGDIAMIALQARAAFDDTQPYSTEGQIYNAYLKIKPPFADIWMGHNRPALGISSYLDSHSHLLPTLAMNGFGYDRDWGLGAARQFDWGDIAVSATTGSGMPIYWKGNYLTSGRVSYGVLGRDNYTVGTSGAYGQTLDTMGYHLMMPDPMAFAMGGIDYALLWDNLEFSVEGMAGRKGDDPAYAFFFRAGINLMDESRLKLEVQPIYLKTGHEENMQLHATVSYIASGDIKLRAMYAYDRELRDHRVVAQAYWYWRAL